MSHLGVWIPMPETKLYLLFTHGASGIFLFLGVGNSVDPVVRVVEVAGSVPVTF